MTTVAAPDKATRPQLPKLIAWALGSGTILQPLNSSVVAVALVPIALAFGDSSAIPWIVSGLYISTAVMSPTAGRLADIFGARRIYLIGLFIVAAASLAGIFAPSAAWLVAIRVLLGIGTAMHFPASMAIIRTLAERRNEESHSAIGVIALCGQTMAALGPTLGGILVAAFGWHGVFLVNIPVAALALILVCKAVPNIPAPERKNGAREVLKLVDPAGALLLVGSLVPFMMWLLSLDGTPHHYLLLIAAPLFISLIVWELRATHPFVDIRTLTRNAGLRQTYGRTFLTFVAFYCVFYGLPQWLQTTGGHDVAVTGLLVLPVFAVGVISTAAATRISRTVRPRILLLVGSGALAVGGLVLAVGIREGGSIYLVLLVAFLLGIPTGFNNIGNQLELHRHAEANGTGAATGMYRTAQYIGACLSTIVVAQALDTPHHTGGIDILGYVVCVAGALLLLTNITALARPTRTDTP